MRLSILFALAGASSVIADVSLAWAASFPFSDQGTISSSSSTNYVVNMPQFVPSMPASAYGYISVTVSNPGGNGVSTGCVTVSSSGGGCNLHVCDSTPQVCMDLMPYSQASYGQYTVTLSNKNWFLGASFSIIIQQQCADGSQVDEFACIPQENGWPPVCVENYNGYGTPYLGLNGCNCQMNICDGNNFCCWDGTNPGIFNSCNGVTNCQDCGMTCPGAPSASPTPNPYPPAPSVAPPQPSASVTPGPNEIPSVSSAPSPGTPASMGRVGANPGFIPGLSFGASIGVVVGCGLAAVAVIAFLAVRNSNTRYHRSGQATVNAEIGLPLMGAA